MLGCFGCAGPDGPTDSIDLPRRQLKALYEKSIAANNGRLIVHGIFARADTKNNNKRVYPKHILRREVAKFEREHIEPGTALGELDHPNYASRYFKCLNLPNISHQVLEVHWRGDTLMGTIEILQTPSGLLLWELYSQGIKLGVSSRGWASLRTDPRQRCIFVDDDFELITFDFVTEPSTKGAFLIPIRTTYREHIPNQDKAVQISHLGHGVCGLEHMPKLPGAPLLAARIAELQSEQAMNDAEAAKAAAAGLPAPIPKKETSRLSYLDKLLLYSHYVVFQDARYLDRESHARDYASHLAMFATRAHLSNQASYMNRADLNALIMREIAKEQAASHAQAGAGGMSQRINPVAGARADVQVSNAKAGVECQATERSDDEQSWHVAVGRNGATEAMSSPPSSSALSAPKQPGDSSVGSSTEALRNDAMLPLPPPGADGGGGGGKPTASASGRGSRVAPEPGSVAASGRGVSPESDVAAEFRLIKGTLSRYAHKYSSRQANIQDELNFTLPHTSVTGLSLSVAVH